MPVLPPAPSSDDCAPSSLTWINVPPRALQMAQPAIPFSLSQPKSTSAANLPSTTN